MKWKALIRQALMVFIKTFNKSTFKIKEYKYNKDTNRIGKILYRRN